jgi:type II secretory pathway pseudopilin PulG
MTGKDIALTTGGVLATMVLAYLLYRVQQRDAAQAQAQQQQAAASEAIDAQYVAQNYNPGLNAYAYDEAQVQAQSPVITGVTSNTTAAVATSSNTADLGAYIDSTDVNNLLSNVVGAFSGSPGITSSFTPAQLAALQIPDTAGVSQTALAGVPVTAQDAMTQALLAVTPAITTDQSTSAAFPSSMLSSASVSSHPVDAHPITSNLAYLGVNGPGGASTWATNPPIKFSTGS